MATIKSYTDLQQSKKLAEILPIESADGYWDFQIDGYKLIADELGYYKNDSEIPCWSLAALLATLSDYTLQTNTDGTVFMVCESNRPMISDTYDNPIDACVAMIEKLNELNLL